MAMHKTIATKLTNEIFYKLALRRGYNEGVHGSKLMLVFPVLQNHPSARTPTIGGLFSFANISMKRWKTKG
jgi:hypothetical protein